MDGRNLWLSKATGPEYTRKIFGIKYIIESCEIIKSSVRPNIEYEDVKDQKTFDLKLEKIIIISKIPFLD